MIRVLVTGGAGYVGSHACKALASAGYLPVAFDNLAAGHRHAVKWGPFEEGDMGDRARLDDVLARHKPAAVLHFAAHAYVGESVADPAKYYRNNVANTLTLLDAMRTAEVRRLVFSSSCATYGQPTSLPIDEDCFQAPINPYGRTKLMAEQIIADHGAAYGLDWAALRYFNAAGADPDGEIGEEHDPETHLVPLVLLAAAGERPHFTVYGTDYDTADGTCVRDYVHVSDLATGHVAALRALMAGPLAGGFNLGTGTGHSILEIIAAARRVTGRDIPVVKSQRRPGDPPVLVADASRATDVLGWRPAYPDIETIIRTAWDWLRHAAARQATK